jgi:transposase-like protein
MKNILEIGDEGKFAPKGKNVRIIRLSNKIVTFLDLSDNKEKSIWKDSFYNRFTKESVDETIDKVLKDRDIEFKKEPTTTNKEEKKSKEDYTLVGIYNDESGVKETEDLTNKDIKGYRIRYNNKQWANYSFGRIIYSLEELEDAKKQLEKANDEAAKDKEYKKQKEAENKIKRLERSKEEAFKLEQAKQDILKKDAYLMEESEYQDKVVPILKEYSKFVNKNKEYLASLGYDTIIYLTFEEILDKNLQGISVGGRYYASKDIEDQKKLTTENWNYEKFGYKGKEEKGTPNPTPKNIIDTNKDYINKLSNFFSDKLIYNGLNKTISKSNKWNVKLAIEDDTYKNMLENETLTEEKLEKIAKSVDVRVPKKVFSDSVIKSRENEKKMNEILKNIPVQNKEKLYELISSVEESFKPLEKQVFEKEKARYIELLNSYVNKDVVSLPVLENVPFWAAALNYESSFSEKKIVSVYKDKYEKDQEVVEYVQKYKGLTLKSNFESIVNRYVLDVVEGLKVKFVEAVLVNFKRITLKMVGFKVLKLSAGYKGFEGEYKFNFINGSSFDFLTQAIGAGGYNIQRYHFRYLSSFNNIVLSDGTKVPNSYYEILTHFSEKMEAGGMVEKPEIVCLKCGWNWKQESSSIKEMYKCHNCGFDLLKEPSSLFKIAKIHKTSVSELEKQLNKGIKVEKEHTNHKHIAKIIALHHLEEDPNYYDKLEKVEGHKMADGGLIYKKIYNRAGGGYTTIINGMLYNINKQYDKGTWVAQSDDGEYYKETQTLAELKDYLKHLNKKNTMADGGDTKSIFYKGYKIGDDGMYKRMNTMAHGGEMEKVGLLAPNGKKSNLTLEQYKLVRTPEFKAWFGDWENDPENASKIVDENGEPLVVYHGGNVDFNVFDVNKTTNKRFHFTPNKEYAEFRGQISKPYFLKIIELNYVDWQQRRTLPKPEGKFSGYANLLNSIKNLKEIVVFKPNQIKLADGTNTTFDINNQDIRYENGGLIIAYEVVYEKLVDGEKERDIKIFKTKEEAERFAKENYGFVENVYDGQYEYANGGEIDPDNKAIKSAMTHKAGSAGGLLVGNRHSEGGIKAINKSSNSPIEMEGGEVVITRNAVSDNSKREFEGQMMTNREILSKINESGGGVSFASGGDVPSSCKCSGKSYKYGGKMVSDFDIINDININ